MKRNERTDDNREEWFGARGSRFKNHDNDHGPLRGPSNKLYTITSVPIDRFAVHTRRSTRDPPSMGNQSFDAIERAADQFFSTNVTSNVRVWKIETDWNFDSQNRRKSYRWRSRNRAVREIEKKMYAMRIESKRSAIDPDQIPSRKHGLSISGRWQARRKGGATFERPVWSGVPCQYWCRGVCYRVATRGKASRVVAAPLGWQVDREGNTQALTSLLASRPPSIHPLLWQPPKLECSTAPHGHRCQLHARSHHPAKAYPSIRQKKIPLTRVPARFQITGWVNRWTKRVAGNN